MSSVAVMSESEQKFERVWRAWQEEGRTQERGRVATRLKLIKWGSMLALALAAALWTWAAEYDVLLRFAVTGGAFGVARQAAGQREYRWVAAFVLLMVLYNPIFPLFSLTGSASFAIVLATLVVFGASLVLLPGPTGRRLVEVPDGV